MQLSRPTPRDARITIRTRPSERRRLEAAAQVAGVTISDVLRTGGLKLAADVLQSAAEEGEDQ